MTTTRTDLDVCVGCGRDFVVPISIVDLLGGERCVVELFCTNCDATALSVCDDAQMTELDRRLDATQRQIRDAVELIQLADDLDRIDRFTRALRDGHILPEDF